MKRDGSKILIIILYVIALIALLVFSFSILIWLDVLVFGLQEPEFTSENNAIFYDYFTKFALLLGGIGLILTALFLLRLVIVRKINKKPFIFPIGILLEVSLIALVVLTIIYELQTNVIAVYSFTVPAFYITHSGLLIIMVMGTLLFVSTLKISIKKKLPK